MTTLKMDGDDLEYDGRNLCIVENGDEVIQTISNALKTAMGEWFLDLGFGMNYDALFAKIPSENDVLHAVRMAIEQAVDGLTGLQVSLDFDRAQRHLTVSFDATIADETVSGEVEI